MENVVTRAKRLCNTEHTARAKMALQYARLQGLARELGLHFGFCKFYEMSGIFYFILAGIYEIMKHT